MGGYPSAEKEEDAGVDDHIFNNPNQGSGDANGPRGTATVKGQSSEEHDQVFHLKVPPGVPPGGCFSAICDGHVVSIQVPHDTYPGDTIQIGVSRNMSSSGNEGGNKEDSEVTREAAKLFLRYDVDKENSISVSELRAMLQNEFQIDDESIRIESELSGVRADDPLTFDEFCSWYYALMVRLHVYKHMQKMKSAMEDVADQGLQQVKENEVLTQQLETQRSHFDKEFEEIAKERERLRLEKAKLDKSSNRYAKLTLFEQRNQVKEKIMLDQDAKNKHLIEQMKEEYVLLNKLKEKEEDQQKEQHRIRLQNKLKEKKAAKEQGQLAENSQV